MTPQLALLHLTTLDRRRPRIVASILSLTLVLARGLAGQQPIPGRASATGVDTDVVALVGGTVIDVESGARLTNRTVVVAGGRIRQVVAAGAAVPRGARVIRIPGRFVIPGLWDMHVEQALPLWDQAPIDSNAALFHPLFLAHGVTGVRDVAGDMEVVRRWRDAIARGEREGPRIVFTGPKVGMSATAAGAPFPLRSATDVEATIAALDAGGASSAYLYTIDSDLLASLGESARRHRLRLEGNVPLSTSLRRQVAFGQRVVDHLDGVLLSCTVDEERVRRTLRLVDEPTWWARLAWRLGIMERPAYPSALALDGFHQARAESLFVQLAAARVYQVPTLRLLGVLNRSGDSLLRLPPPPLELRPPRRPYQGWASEPHPAGHPLARVQDRLLWMVGAMSRAGVPILAGSDTPNLYAAPGLALHDELQLLVRAGLTPLQALQSATVRPAEMLGATDSLGTVTTGRVADLLVLSADPTVDIGSTRRIELVMARGRVYDAPALARLRARGTAMAREVEAYWVARQKVEP